MMFRIVPAFSRLVILFLLVILLLMLAAFAVPVHAATLPDGFSQTIIASGLALPTGFAFAPDGRIFVAEQRGAIRIIQTDNLLPTPFATVSTVETGDIGLLGITLHPDFPATPYVYVYYAVPGNPLHMRLGRLTADGNLAQESEPVPLIDLDDLAGPKFHVGGALHFGPDQKLYLVVGDDGISANAKTLTNLSGKVLRYNEDGGIPADNPFYDGAGENADAIWAYGLRNPYSFAFQPGTGRIFISDVGEKDWEEINDGVAGANYGWPACEGECSPSNSSFTDPEFAYAHGTHNAYGCAIIGGAFYNPTTPRFPADYTGSYFYGDVCGDWIHRYDAANDVATDFATHVDWAIDMHVSDDGALYYLGRTGGTVVRITYHDPPTQTPSATITSTQTASATFTLTASLTHTMTFTPTTTNTGTFTPTATNTQTFTATASRTFTPTRTRTETVSATLTPTGTATASKTWTPTASMSWTPTSSSRPTGTPSVTPSVTPTVTQTACPVSKPTPGKPSNDAIVNHTRVRLDWANVPCAQFYRLKLRNRDGTGGTRIKVTLSKYRSRALKPGGHYQYRIFACAAAGCKKSRWTSFTVSGTAKP